MKIRIIAVIYTLLVLAGGLYLWFGTGDRYSMPIDMLDLNTKCDEISDRLSAGESVDALENEYDCEITLLTDDNYESVNNYFIKEGLSVFDYREEGVIKGKIAFNVRPGEYAMLLQSTRNRLLVSLCIFYAAGLALLFVIWYFYIRPFKKLSFFASNVSKGNLDVPLNMDKHNYFGAFTESFDRMREELKLSSEREAAANRSKQELVAEISHDIKTPVATIKATCEVMEIKYEEPDIREKVSVIKSKASSVEHLPAATASSRAFRSFCYNSITSLQTIPDLPDALSFLSRQSRHVVVLVLAPCDPVAGADLAADPAGRGIDLLLCPFQDIAVQDGPPDPDGGGMGKKGPDHVLFML